MENEMSDQEQSSGVARYGRRAAAAMAGAFVLCMAMVSPAFATSAATASAYATSYATSVVGQVLPIIKDVAVIAVPILILLFAIRFVLSWIQGRRAKA